MVRRHRRRRGACRRSSRSPSALAGYAALPGLLGIPTLAVSAIQGRRLRAELPGREAHLPQHLALRRPRRSIRAPTCTSRRGSPTTPPSTCRRCPPTPISACTSTATGRKASCATSPPAQTAYFRYLPMYYPYVIKQAPDTFVVQFGGGISTDGGAAQRLEERHRRREQPGGARRLSTTGRSAISPATSSPIRAFTSSLRGAALPRPHRRALRRHRSQPRRLGRPLQSGRLRDRREIRLHARGDAQLHARARRRRHPLGDAVEQGGAAEVGPQALRHHGRRRAPSAATSPNDFFVASSYLATTTVLYKRGGFTADEIAKLREHTRAMSFDEIYSPGFAFDPSQSATVLDDYRRRSSATAPPTTRPTGGAARRARPARPDGAPARSRQRSGGRRSVLPATTAWPARLECTRARRL